VGLLVVCWLLCVALPASVWAAEEDPARLTVIVSLKIKPYMDAVQGIQEKLAGHTDVIALTIVFMDPQNDADNASLAHRLSADPPRLAVAIGPEAMAFLWNRFPSAAVKKIYAMVLDPERIVPGYNGRCGIGLNIPAERQIREFREKLPELKRIGLIYHPGMNQGFAERAKQSATASDIELLLLAVDSLDEISVVLRRHWTAIEALWMIPDRVVISESLIPYMIKSAMANNVAVIGYNRYFIDSGAACALVRKYGAMGSQTAEMALSVLGGDACEPVIPAYEVLINPQVLKTVGLPYAVDSEKEGTP
jgi:putative ABC transport system substrate-binding protein